METTASLVASIVSVIIGGFAIWLSVTFYRMSNKISEDTKEAAKGISASVNRLESLFDSLYSDTFSIMKDTVYDMRKHIWPEKERPSEELKQIEKKADVKIDELKRKISDELSGIMKRFEEDIGRTDTHIDVIEKNFKKLFEQAIQQTRKVESEAQEEKAMSDAMSSAFTYVHLFGVTKVRSIINSLRGIFSQAMIINALKQLVKQEQLFADGNIENPDTRINDKPF